MWVLTTYQCGQRSVTSAVAMGAIFSVVGSGIARMVRTADAGFWGDGADVVDAAGWLVGADVGLIDESGEEISGWVVGLVADMDGEPGCEAARSSSSSLAKAVLRLPCGRVGVMTAVSAMVND